MERTRWLLLILVTSLAWVSAAAATEDRAGELYYQGLAEVEAILPSSDLAMPSTVMPCVNCHGADGQGGREGGVAVPPISWRRLGMATIERPAYDRSLLTRALRDGIGADGAPLHQLMPRYAVSDDLASNIAHFLRAIGPKATPGVTDDEIVVAIPSTRNEDPSTTVIGAVLRDYVDRLNGRGGLYGRTIRLIDDRISGEPAFARLAATEPPDQTKSPPLDLWPLRVAPDSKPAFPLIPADERLLENLLEAARRDDPAAERLSTLDRDGRALPATLVFDGHANRLSTLISDWSGPAPLTIYTTPDHVDLARLQHLSPRPLRIVLANPFATGEPDDGAQATGELMSFGNAIARLRLPETARPVARAAWVAASMLEKTLRATGRHLDQKRFEAALRSTTTFDSGLLMPVDPTGGLTAIGLVRFDFTAGKVTQTMLALN